MPYVYAEFNIIPPIREAIGKVPDDIELLDEQNGAITGLRVILGEELTEKKIKSSGHFKEILAESEKKNGIAESSTEQQEINKKSENYINQLEQEFRNYANQKAKNFINQLNFRLGASTYKVQYTTLAILMLKRNFSIGVGGYIKSDLKTDIFEIDDEDNFLNRILNYYTNGLEAQKNGDLISAYKYFYLVIPEGQGITSDSKLNLDLKILRHGVSHLELTDKKLMDRAKELLGDEYVKDDGGKKYAYVDLTIQRHIDLFNKHTPIIRKYGKEYIEKYIQSHT
ncbi:MAG: hypothetical protein ABR985_04735 [Methanotrichaceae archaeon]|jgi:hypothetical protein